VVPADLAVTVRLEIQRGREAELADDMAEHPGRYVGRVRQEGAQKTRRDQLEGETDPVMLPLPPLDLGAVAIIKVEVARELGRRGLGGKAAVYLLSWAVRRQRAVTEL
jgi:hypothetical protein